MDDLLALVGFSFVSAATPGPNNVLLSASGASFGFRRTVPHIVGTAVGIGVMAMGVAAGLGAVVAGAPGLVLAMKVAGSAYLLFLAVQLARAGAFQRGQVARPLGLTAAALFQAANPKGWLFVLGAMSTFRPDGMSVEAGSLLVVATMVAVILPSASLWALAGDALYRLLGSERRRRVVSVVLAAVVAGTVILVWV